MSTNINKPMDIEELVELPEKFLKRLIEKGIKRLNPVQSEAVEKGLLEGINMVVASPTASGKTLIAILAAASNLFKRSGKVIYLVPLRALANEKFEEFQEFFHGMFKVAMSTGDYDSTDSWLEDYDIIILTVEKADSLMRHKAQWMNDISLVIADEVHLLNDPERGPTLEVVLTKLKELSPQILALSATIKNAEEIALWLNAEIVKSNYRPVKLREGVLLGKKIRFIDEEQILKSLLSDEAGVVEDTLLREKQILVFVSTRKNAETLAERLAPVVEKYLSESEKLKLKKLAEKLRNALETPTVQCKKLASLCEKGVVFHHAGLVGKQRSLIENAFKENLLKVIVATPTLAAGVNLPAYRVLIRDVKRFYPGYGALFIPVLEYQQMAGRAGRPKYDKEGQAIILARTERAAKEIFERYVLGEPEEIYSKLALEPVMRSHVLALICTSEALTEEQLYDFFEETFYAYQYGDASRVCDMARRILDDLIEWGFAVQINEKLIGTRMGKRVSDLYIDPESGWKIISALQKHKPTEFGLLHLICSLREMKPSLTVRNSEYKDIQDLAAKRSEQLMIDSLDWLYVDEFLESFKTAIMLERWINEADEEYIYEKFGVTPGELYMRIEIADWLLYAVSELGLLIGVDIKELVKKLRLRIKHGVKEELLELVSIKGIGRKRARKLWNAGIKSIKDLKQISVENLKRIVGEITAEKIKEAVL